MRADTSEMGKEFLLLTQARTDAEMRQAVEDYDGQGTALLDYYVLAGNSENVTCTTEQLGAVELLHVNTVMVYGSDELRGWTSTVLAYKDAQGQLWMDAQMHDEVFC